MTEQTKQMIRGWVAKDNVNTERTAQWIAKSLRIGGVTVCREMVD